MAIRWQSKRLEEVVDRRHDWAPFLGDDTIASQVTTAQGVTLDSAALEAGDKSIKVWLSGGVEGTAYVTQTITTSGGRTESEVFIIRIGNDEPVSLAEAKEYLRVYHDDEDAKIEAMIPRARRWVELETGQTVGLEATDLEMGAMLALIEGEFSDGFAYPARAVQAAKRCIQTTRTMVA